MAISNALNGHYDAVRLRKEAGLFVRRLREQAGRTQRDVARDVGLDYYTMVSQIEHGKSRVPPDKMQNWAQAVGAEPREFAKRLLRYYDPYSWQMIFGGDSEGPGRGQADG